MSLDQNGKALNSLLKAVNGLPRVQKYGNAVFFGDSLSFGHGNIEDTSTGNENGEYYSFVDVLQELGAFNSVVNHSLSGATIGPYSINGEEIDKCCLINQIETYAADIQNADIIFLEYGANDWSSLENGKVMPGLPTDTSAATTICGYTRKAMERIMELAPKARIVWLAFMRWDGGANLAAYNDYFLSLHDTMLMYEFTLYRVVRICGGTIINLNDGLMMGSNMNETNHPTTLGHQYLAQNVLQNLFKNNESVYPTRMFTVTATATETAGVYTYSVDGHWGLARAMIEAGDAEVRLRMADPTTGLTMIMQPALYGDTYITFMGHGFYNGVIHPTLIWNLDGTISMSY